MNVECIHGLDLALCDLCTPRPMVVPAAPLARVKPAPGARARTSLRSGAAPATPRRVTASTATTRTFDNVGVQRLYHVTHVNNLAAILGAGRLVAPGAQIDETRPVVDASSPAARTARSARTVADDSAATVADFVPFYLTPNSTVWMTIRSASPHTWLSSDVAAMPASDFVILVSTVQTVIDLGTEESGEPAMALSLGDAAHVLTSFGTTVEDVTRGLRSLRADEESPAILNAEFLVRDEFPVEHISLIGVANDRARDVVKAILADADFTPKVAVYPPWFQRPEED